MGALTHPQMFPLLKLKNLKEVRAALSSAQSYVCTCIVNPGLP